MSDKQAKPSLSNEHNYGLQYDQNKSDLADNNDTRKLKEETIDANKPELTGVLEPLEPSPSVGNNDDNKKNGKDAHSRPLQKNAKQGGTSTKPSVDMHRTESITDINKDNLTIKNKNLDDNNPEFEDKKDPYKEEYTSDDNTNNTPPEIRLTPPNFDQGSTEPLKDSTNGIIPGEDNLTMPTILSDFISQKNYLVTLVNEGQSIDQEKQQLIKTLLGNIDKCIKGYLKNFNISKKLKDLLPNKHLSTFQQEEILNTLNKDYYRLLNGFIQELKEMRAK